MRLLRKVMRARVKLPAKKYDMKDIESEKKLEARLVSEVKRRGGIAVKNTSQFHRGLPDRIVLLPYHTFAFVELKSTGEKSTALQSAVQGKLWQMGYTVYIVDSSGALDAFLAKMDRRLDKIRHEEETLIAELTEEEFSEV